MEAVSLRSGLEAEPTPQSFSELVHRRRRLSSLDPPSCQRSACHHGSRKNLDLGPSLSHLGLAHLGCPGADLLAEGAVTPGAVRRPFCESPGLRAAWRLAGSWRGRAPGTNAPPWLLPAAPLMPTGAACPAEGIVEDKSCRKLYKPNENNPGTARELIAVFPGCRRGCGKASGSVWARRRPARFVAPGAEDTAFTSKRGESLCLSQPQLSHV